MPGPFLPTATLAVLEQRAKIVRSMRAFFESRDFLEVDTPVLSHDTVVDRFLDPFEVRVSDSMPRMFLQTSPEFGMKRLLAGGARKIFQITRAFRRDEQGKHHNPEFAMLEWYEADADYQDGMNRLAEFSEELLPNGSCRRVTYSEAFSQAIGLDPIRASTRDLRTLAYSFDEPSNVDFASFDRDNLLNWLFSHKVQPTLGEGQSVILFDWPVSQAALARTRTDADGVTIAERFELYAGGLELANGYYELLDPQELKRRNEENNRLRIADHRLPLPVQSRLLEAMEFGLPSCSGVALGIDRLVMRVLGLDDLRDVLAFPFDRA